MIFRKTITFLLMTTVILTSALAQASENNRDANSIVCPSLDQIMTDNVKESFFVINDASWSVSTATPHAYRFTHGPNASLSYIVAAPVKFISVEKLMGTDSVDCKYTFETTGVTFYDKNGLQEPNEAATVIILSKKLNFNSK